MKKQLLALSICLTLTASANPAEACTTLLITPGASADHSMYVTHSNDAGLSDPSIVYVPAKDHPAGSRRPVYPSAIAWDELPSHNCFNTPRLVDPERAPGYAYQNEKPTIPLGWIPEVEHTYAYIDTDYGVMNEHGLMFGECTNNSRSYSMPADPGSGLFYSSELSRVALERCRTAREAVTLIGNLIDTYGLYGTGETLLIADRTEGWILEMQPVPGGSGGLWIAKRVPDGTFFAAANQFRIRDIETDNPDLLFNPELPQRLEKLGWAVHDPATGKLDWLRSMNGTEDFHPYFSLRRIWRAMSLLAPSQNLPARVKDSFTRDYPFSIKPDKPITLAGLMALHRDCYEGTEFDLTKGDAAGLFGSPYRYGPANWNRPIGYRISSYARIMQAKEGQPNPVAWIALAIQRESTYVPLAVAPMPAGYEQVDRRRYDPSKPWWTYMQTAEFVQGRVSVLEGDVHQAALAAEKDAAALVNANRNLPPDEFAARLRENALHTEASWKELYGRLLVEHNQGKETRYTQDLPGDDVSHY